MTRLGQAINRRRSDFGFSLDEVARLAGLTSDRLGAIEAGDPPKTFELQALADALAVEVDALRAGTDRTPRRAVARFRSELVRMPLTARDLRVLARAAEIGRVTADLWRILGKPDSPVVAARTVVGIAAGEEPWRQGYALGEAARLRLLASPAAPLASVQGSLERWGVHVMCVDLETEDIEAAALYESAAHPVIVLNRRAGRVRDALPRRAILAHELGHLLHDGGERDLLTVVSAGRDVSGVEQRANGFAPSFIAPAAGVGVISGAPRDIALEIGRTWGLSFEGVVWHAKNLRLIEASVADQLARSRSGGVDAGQFEEDIPRSPTAMFGLDVEASSLTSGLLSELTLVAFADGIISEGRAKEILRME